MKSVSSIRIMLRHFFLLLPTLFLCQTLLGQECSITLIGKITGINDSLSLPYASIYLPDQERGTVTDDEGRFVVSDLCEGEHQLQISYVGYKRLDTLVSTVNKNFLHFFLRPVNIQLDDVTVEAKRNEQTIQSVEKISGLALQTKGGSDLAHTLKGLSGVQTLKTTATTAKPVIHGLHGNRILILNNGVRLEAQQWRLNYAPEIDPFVAQEISLIQGANSVRYGSDAIGGVVLLNPPPLRKKAGIDGVLNLIGWSNSRMGTASASLAGQLKQTPHLSWRIQGTLKRAGNSKAPDYWMENTGVSEYNFSGELGYQRRRFGLSTYYSQFNSRVGIYRGSHNHNLRDIVTIFEGGVPPDTVGFSYEILRPRQNAEHELFKVNGWVKPLKTSLLRLTYARQFNRREEFDITHGLVVLDESKAPQLGLSLTTHSLDFSWDQNVTKNWASTIGAYWSEKKNNFSGISFIPRYESKSWATYAIQSVKLQKVKFEVGARYDVENREVEQEEAVPEFKYSNWSFNMGMHYFVSSYWHLNANVGRAWRATTVAELFSDGVNHGEAAYEIGDQNLDSERVNSFILGLNYNNYRGLRSKLTIYHKRFDNYIYLSPPHSLSPYQATTVTIRGIFPTYVYTQAKANFTGADLDLQIPVYRNIALFFKGSVVRGNNKTKDEPLVLIAPDTFTTGLEWKLANDGPFNDSFIRFSFEHQAEQKNFPDSTEIILPPLSSQIFHLDAVFNLQWGRQPVILGFSINNIFNTTYRTYLNRMRYYIDEPGRNFALRLQIPFRRNFKSK